MIHKLNKLCVILLVTLICLPLLLSIGAAQAAQAPTVNVKPGDSIQAAINSASPGAKIIVHRGTYNTQASIIVNKTVTLIGKCAVIQYTKPQPQSGVGDYAAIFIRANNVEITGFTINVSYLGATGGVLTAIELGGLNGGILPKGTLIDENIINSPDWGISGIYQKDFTIKCNAICAEFPLWFTSPENAVIKDNIVTAKQYDDGPAIPDVAYTAMQGQMAGIKLTGAALNCKIANNIVTSQVFGILTCMAAGAAPGAVPTGIDITANVVISKHDGIYADAGTNFTVKNNLVTAANYGIYLADMHGTATVSGNIVVSGGTKTYVG